MAAIDGDTMQPANLAALLEPYRGRRKAIVTAFGAAEAWRLLWAYCNGSPAAAAEFSGYGSTTVSEAWHKHGLPITPRDPNQPAEAEWTEEDWYEFWRRQTAAPERAIPWEWRLPSGTEYGKLHFLGDLHFGNQHQDSEKLLEFVEWMAGQPDDRWILMGDLFELRTKTSKGELPLFSQDVAMSIAKRVLKPIMAQCVVCHSGNHDQRVVVKEDVSFDPVRDFANAFGVPYNGLEGFHVATVHCGRREQKYIGYCHHGFGGARTPGARQNQLIQLLSGTNADYAVIAHLHDKQAGGKAEYGPDPETLLVEQWARPVARCGSFLKHEQGSYSRQAGMPPGIPGAATLYLHLDKHDVHGRH